MASFLHQLKVLLWKNWLSVYRQPVWSVVLIFWPVIIFFIMAMTRIKFPHVQVSDCYLAPRNLQSTGMIPFLQSFLCETDVKCMNTSYAPDTVITRSRLKKRSVDPGGGGSTFQMRSSSDQLGTLWHSTAGDNWTIALEVINLGKTIVQDLSSGDVKGALCSSTTLFPATQLSTFQNFCNTNQTVGSFALQAVFSQASNMSSTEIVLAVKNISTYIQAVQSNSVLWNFLLMLPEWIKNPQSFTHPGEFVLNFTTVPQEISYLQTCMNYMLTTANQIQNISSISNLIGILETLSEQSLNSEMQSCISLFQLVPYGSGQSWLQMEQTYKIIYFLVTSLSNGTSSNSCEFNGLSMACNGSISWDIFLQSSLAILKEVSVDPPGALIRVVQRAWKILKQNMVEKMILQKLEQEITSNYPSNPQLQRVLTQLVHLLLNTTDILITESSMDQYFGVLQTLLDQMNMLVPPELLNMQSVNSTDLISNLTQSIVKVVQYWIDMSGLLSSSNVSSQILVDLQILIKSLSTLNSEIATFNDTAILLKILSSFNQPAFRELQKTLETLLSLNPVTSDITTTLTHAFNLFSEVMSTSSLTNSSVLADFYLKQILNFVNTDTTLQNNLAFLNSYFNYTQLAFLQSDALSSYAANIVFFFTPSNLQTMSSNPNNVSLELLKLISNFIPAKEQEIFHKVETVFMTLLDSVSTCQMEFSNCTGSIFIFQQQLSDVIQFITSLNAGTIQQIIESNSALQFVTPSNAEIAVVNNMFLMILCSRAHDNSSCNTAQDIYKNTLGQLNLIANITLGGDTNILSILPLLEQIKQDFNNVLQVLGSVDLTKLTSQLDNITSLSNCYRNTLVNPLQCTMELSSSLMDLLQMLPFPQPTNDILLVVSSIAKNWLGEINGTANVYQQLTYLYNLLNVAFHNQSTLQKINTNLFYIVQSLEELRANVNLSSIATGKLIGDLLDTFKFANINYAFPTTLLSQTNQELENIKTQLQTVQWYVLYVKNETKTFQTSGNIDSFVTMAKLIIGNVLSTVRSNPSLAPIAYDAEYVINWLEKSRIIPILQSILNDTLQGGVQSMDAFINHTVSIIEMIIQQEFVNGTVWNPLFNEIPDSDITFMLKLLQQYDGETLANLSSVLVLTENFLLTVDNLVKDFHPETAFNYNLQTIYNISQEVMSILYNAEQKSSMNKSVLYDIYNLFLENWNGNIFHELPLLKEKLMELLHLSIQCLSESMTPSLKHNCSSTDIIQMVQLILNDLGCQVSLDLPITDGNMTLNCIMEYALNSTWHINMTECAIKNDNIKEELACLAKALEITVHLISRTTNNLLDQNTTWVPEMDKALSLVTDKLSTNNFECVAIDRQIVYMMYQVFENQSSPLQPLISLFLNQTLYSTDLSQYPVYLVQVSNLVKLYISTQEHLLLNDTVFKLWNDTMLQLFEITQFRTNSSKLLVASEILKTVRNLSSYLGTVEESTEFFHMLNILNRVMNLTSATLSVNPSLPHVSLANIFYGNFSTIVVKLIQQVSSELNIKSVESCENSLHDLLTLYQSSMNLSFSGIFYSNMSSWACSLLSNNSGFDWLEELKAITSMIISLEAGAQVDSTMKIPSSFIQFVNYTRMDTFENLVTSIIGILNEKDPQMNFILFQTFHELVNYLQSIVKEVLSSGNISPVFTAENVIINTMGAVNIILKNLNITCYEEIFTLTSEVFQIYFNMTNSTLPMESLAQKILVHIWTSFQKSGLENVVVQSLQSQILSQSSEKQKILQNFLNIVISAINETASESALESPSYTKKLIFNIIENIVEQLNSTELLESLCGNKDITELIVSLVNGIQQSAKNWNNVSQVMTFPQNGTNQAVNALENLLNSWISENTGKKELYFNYSTNTINIFYLFFSQAEKAHVMQILHYFLDFNNGTINVPVLLSTLENMYDLFNLNNTNSVNVLELYIKQLLNFIADSQINQTLSELSFLLNTSQKLSFFQTGELREAALELLTFFDPPSLYNITKDSSNLVSMLLNLLTMNISHEELQSFNNITDAIVSLLQLVNNCSKVSESCVSAVSGFEMLVVDVVNAIASTGNGTLYLEISNETVQEFEKLTNAQISLINIIFSMLWNAQKHIHNYSGDFPNVYQEVLSASKLILNLTRELNTNTAQSDFEMLKNYSQQISIIQKIISTNKITEFLLQIINIHRQSQCTNQTLLCTFNLTSHLLSFLGKLQVSNPVMERILVVSSIVEYWMGEINTTADIYQQMVSLYGLTKAALQNEPGLHTIQATLTDISQIIQNIKVDNTSFSAMEELILTFVKLLQPDNNVILPNNAMYINSAQLQDVKAQIQIIQWYIMYIKNQTENYNMSSDIYAFYRLAQFSLTNMMPSIQDWFINVGHSYNVTEFLTLVNLSSHEIDTLFQLLQQLLTTNQTNLGAMSQLENWIQLLEISKQINTVQGLNTSEFTTIWQVIKNIMAGDLSITQIDEILKAVQTAITMQNITVGTDITQLYDLFLGILNQTHSTGNMNLTQILHFSVDSFLTMDCQGVFKILTAVYKMIKNTNPSSSWPDDMFFSNLTMDICGLLHWNYSQNDSVSLLQTSRGIILYVAPLVPDSMRKYFSAAEYILELAVQLIADPAITQNNIVTIMNIVPVINGLLNNKSSSTDWVESKIFQKLIYFLLDFVWTSSSPKEVLLLKGQNFILTMVQDIQDMLKAQPGYPYNAWLSFALDMVETFINRTQNTSSEDRFLKDVWDSFKQNGLESVIISTVGQLVSNNGSTSNETANTLELLLRLVFNFTDLIISEIPLSALNVGKDTTIKILQLALSDFFQILLPQNKNTTPVLVEDLQSVMNVTRIFSQLEMLINSFTTVNIQANISNNPDHLFNLLSALNQTGLISDITTFIQGLITSDNMQYSKLFLDALKMFQDFVQINNTINIQDLSAIITKYLPVYLEISNETQSSLNAILNLWQYLNNMTGAHSSHLSNTLVHILPFFQSHILLNESIDVSNLTSWLVNLISGYIPSAERETFEKATNASLLLIESMQSCTVKPQTCTDLIEGIQNFVSDVIQLESGIQNRTVANSSLLQFVSYNQSEITLLNDIVLVLSYAMGHPYNSTNQTGVYEDFLTLKNWFLNTTMEDNVNVTAPASLQNLVEVLTSVNITQFLLQIENMLHTSTCTSQADIHPLFCKLNVMFQFTQLLNLLPLEQTTNSNLSIISSVAGQWLSQINSNISIYQQLIDLYNVTVLAIQYQPTLQAINISLVNIVHILQNLGVLQNVNLNGSDIAIHLLSEMIQKVESETNMYNLSSVLQYNISELLETIQLQLDTVNWLMLQVEKKPGMFNSSLKVNTVAQWMIDNYQHISLIIRDVEFMINSFNHVFNLTDLLHIFNVAIQNEQIQALIHQIEAEIFTKASSHLLMNENIQKDAEIALFLLQEINRVNTSLILTSINQVYQTIQGIKGLDLGNPFYNKIIAGKVLPILNKGMGILYDIQVKGTIGKEALYQIYNFTYLLVQDEWNWVPFQNISSMEAELLDVFYLAMTPFLGGNGSQAYIGNCSAQDVLQILVQTISRNATGNEPLVKTTCNWQLVSNSSDSSPSSNHTLDDMIYLALQSSPVFHNVCNKDSLHPLAEEMACLMQVMRISIGVLADLNNMSGLQMPLIQTLNNSLTFMCNNMPDHNSTFQSETQLLTFLDAMFFNQSNPIHMVIQFLIKHYNSTMQTSDLQQIRTEISRIVKVLAPVNGSFDNHICELIEAVVNFTIQPNWFESWQAFDNVLSMNWTFTNVDVSLSVLERLRRAFVLINSGMDAKTLQIYQAIVSLLKNPNFTALLDMTNPPLMNATLFPVAECTAALNAVATFSDSLWAAFDPTHSNLEEELLVNFTVLACEVLHFQSWNYTWMSNLETIKHILPYLVHYIPAEITHYFIALEKIISFLSDILRSPNISQENIVGGVYELFIQELMIFSNTTIITDWIEKIPIRNFISILFSLNSNVTTEQVIILEKDVLYLLSRILNATSYSQGYSMLSDLITYLPDNTSSLTTVNGIIQQLTNLMTKFIVTVQIPPLTEPYGTLMNCVKNVTEDLSGHLSGHLEVAIQLAQDLFTLSNESANTSMIPDLLKQKIYQLQNLTTLVCGLDGSSNSQSFCYLPCQYLTLLQNVTDLVTAGIKVTQTATSMNSPVIITSVLGSISQSIENEISTKLSSIFPINDLTNITAQLSMYINETKVDFQAILGNIFHNSSHVEEQLSQVVKLNQTSITALMSVPIPNDTIQIGAWFTTLNQCNTNHSLVAEPLQVFCNLSPEQGYQMAIIFLQNVDILKLMYRLLVPSTWQASLDMILTALKSLIEKLEGFLQEMPSEQEFTDTLKIMKKLLGLSTKSTRKRRSVDPSVSSGSTRANTASLTDITKRMCSGNYRGLSQALYSLYPMTKSSTNRNSESAQNLSTLYGIPTDNSFCLNLFTDLVETSSGAAYWILLKPLLYGQILYTPNTPETQKIMQKTSNSLLQMENYKAIINNASTNMQKILDNWPFLQVAQNLIGVLESILNNTVISSILEEFLKINTTDLSVKLNAADNFIEKLGSNIDLITVFQNICEVLVNLMSCMSYIRIQPMNSPADMSAKAEQLQKTNELFAAVTFHLPSGTSRQKRSVSETSGLPKQIKYTISMRSLLSENTNSIRDSNWIPEPHNTVNKYSRGFVYLQENIERAIIEMQTNKTLDNVGVQYQPMPFPCHKKDSFLYSMSFSLPIALMITWVLFIAAFVKKLVHEKELRLHEYMKMMGINSCSHFFAWFIESACFLIITVSILVLILKFGKILSLSNGFILFLFFLDYSLTVIAMSYLISVFFHNTNVAALSGSLIYIITFFPFIVVVSKEASLSFAGKTLLSLFSPTALSYATQYLVHFEEQGEGIQWHNIYNSTVKNDTFNFGWLCWLMLIDAMIYFVVGWYIRIVFPGKYGIGTPWYFPVLPSFWRECCGFQTLCSRKPSGLMISNIVSHGMPEKKGDDLYPHHEQEPTDLNVGVSLHGLTKVYKSKSAVQNLNLNFYEGHITSLLGHNGAGKTTTLSMLTGLFSATSGTIYVYGEDIRTRLDQARKNMGVCMQYDVLFDHLTTKEHLLLYGSIKAPQWNQRQLHEEVKSTLKETGLYSHRHKPVKTLSGGMRRKLSICIALIGGSRVVILDEPTTGVDPCSRRSIWEVISKNKKDKTIILSTHHLDEAEVLSDRIAFLEQGGLRCCGTPMFLKEKFGSGYHLTLTKKFPNQNDDKQCDSEAVTSLIQSHIPEATLKEDVGGELVYVLPPFRAEISNAYLSLLRDLDTNMNDLYIGCYGISDTTIEEVFLKLTDGLDEDDQELSNRAIPIPSQDLIVDDESSSNSYSFFDRDDQQLTKMENVRGVKLLLKKIMAILIKRFHNSKRNWKGLISQILLPVLFVIAAMGLGSLSMSSVDYPELLLTPGLYGTTDQAVVFRISNKSSEDLMNAMSSFPGIDDSCLNQNSQCLPENSLGSWNPTADQTFAYDNCSCSVGYEVCAALDASPPHRMTYSRQMMYNLTGKNMENYLLATTLQFVQTRYGGWSFGVPASQLNSFVPVSDNLTLNKVWYNNEGPHSLPAFLNSFSNFLLRANLPSNESAQYSISVYNKPLPGAVTQPTITMALVNTLVALSVLVGYSITTASFVTYVVKEHDNGSKRLQHIAGVGEVCYWVTNFLYDLAIYFIPVALSIAMVAAFKLPAFSNYPNLGGVSILFILFGYATFSWMYLIAGTFKNAGMAFITYVCINLFIGINTIISSSVVYMLTQQKSTTDQDFESLNTTYNALINVFKIFPQFCFGYGLIQLSQQQAMQDQLAIYGNYDKVDIFKMDILGYMFLAMAVQGTFCFALRLLINDGIIYSVKTFFKKIFKMYPNLLVKNPEEDEDVTAESERVVSGNANDDLLVLQGLTKIFHQVNKNVIAVHNMSLGIPPGECFGLLGVNGAGKTTTFKMLTGDISPSAGNIQVRNHTGNLMNVLGFNTDWSSFGYCPQEDALDELMTGEEHLYYYARIHGIPERRIKSVTNQLLQKLQLVQYKDRITANYSCGTRRKLSTALALIGKPSILLLDEPSSGMDPKTKRHLWKIISEEIQENCAVVLTSHSMEECEALCTRLAIMVKGKFQCIGSLQHIKSRFGSGFTVKMHLKDSSVSVETITGFMHLQFPNTYLKEQHFTMVEYHVPVSAGGVATIFDLLESNKIALNIIHFSVSQTTLDEVFINFAQAQASLDNSSASSQEFQQVVMA